MQGGAEHAPRAEGGSPRVGGGGAPTEDKGAGDIAHLDELLNLLLAKGGSMGENS